MDPLTYFMLIFIFLIVICFAVRSFGGDVVSQDKSAKSQSFITFQRKYLLVYLLSMSADWLQGPYVYALYGYYGFSKAEIGLLFIAGFMSSAVFGTFVGSLADKFGRKSFCMLYGILYAISCLTKLSRAFEVLLFGRLLSGISTSLLFSVLESWMISEHKSRGFNTSLLSDTFSISTFGNGIAAIAAGLLATLVANHFGFVAPFILAFCFLTAQIITVGYYWTENYGDSTISVVSTFTRAWKAITTDIRVLLLGAIQSLFEASMYTFVFMWTPALQSDLTLEFDLPFGVIFACFMVCVMIGSSLFSITISKLRISAEDLGSYLLLGAGLSLSVPIFTTNMHYLLLAFFVFEIACGLYFPCFGTLRSKYIPEDCRSAVMNFIRIPLNLLVVLLLKKVGTLSNSTVFLIATFWLGTAYILHLKFKRLPNNEKMLTNALSE